MSESHQTAPRLPGRPWIWFDLDDTLWDFSGNSLKALAEVYGAYSLDRLWPTLQEWYDSYHAVNSELWVEYAHGRISRDYLRMERFRRPLVGAGCPDGEARRLSAQMDTDYLARLGRMTATVPGARGLLERLRPYYNIGVLSNGFRPVQYDKMKSAGIYGLIDCTVLSDEIEVNKPDPRLFDYACRKGGTDADRCLLIGDNPETDIAGALNAGWQAVLFCPAAAGGTAPAIPGHEAVNVPVAIHLDQIWPLYDPNLPLPAVIIKKSR